MHLSLASLNVSALAAHPGTCQKTVPEEVMGASGFLRPLCANAHPLGWARPACRQSSALGLHCHQCPQTVEYLP